MIAEYRRLKFHEQIVYLCPTKQLCNQVATHAKLYGISHSLLIGPQRDYDMEAFVNFQRGNATAITTYSAIFNMNPRINAQVIICDDAHAGDNYISSQWSLYISSQKHTELFNALVQILKQAISADMSQRIKTFDGDAVNRASIEFIPAPAFIAKVDELSDALETYCSENSSRNLSYGWQALRGHLQSCNIYLSPDALLIRPLISPTETHSPFARAC